MILDKFKEKKQMVVTALRDASDACYQSVSSYCILAATWRKTVFMVEYLLMGAQWLSGRVLDRRHCVVSLSKTH